MPLNKGLRDEENERINNILKKLQELLYVPDFAKQNLEEPLKFLGLNLETLSHLSSEELIEHLEKFHFDWENAEHFADFLVNFSGKLNENNLKEKALAVYHYIQSESKTFSFEIFNKIASVKATL